MLPTLKHTIEDPKENFTKIRSQTIEDWLNERKMFRTNTKRTFTFLSFLLFFWKLFHLEDSRRIKKYLEGWYKPITEKVRTAKDKTILPQLYS